jgi:hypothetical protein
MTEQRRRLADRLIDAGTLVARTYAEQDRLDPTRPPLSVLVAETLADHERIGEERVHAKIRGVIAQRTQLRDERLTIGRRFLDAGNLPPAVSEFAWASALDEQIAALRSVLL